MSRIGLAVALLFVALLFLYFLRPEQDPGMAWKVHYSDVPELQNIYERFRDSCKVPKIPEIYFEDVTSSPTYQTMRKECSGYPNQEKWTRYETMTSDERLKDDDFYTIDRFFDRLMYKVEPESGEERSPYRVRLGCFIRKIEPEIEAYANEQIRKLMKRANIESRFSREVDARGSTYMPPGGFMEYHTNRSHHIAWRLYFHHLQGDGESYFAYKHPYDDSVRHIADSNLGCNMFKIRPESKRLLWHSIWSETHRFSFGIYIDPELAQWLKTRGKRT